MKFTMPKFSTIVSYASGVATLIVAAQAHVSDLPFNLPPQVLTILAGVGLLARAVLHFTQAPSLSPTPDLDVEDGGAKLGKASGEAGSAASKGPFKR